MESNRDINACTFFILAQFCNSHWFASALLPGWENVWMIALMVSGAISSQRQARWHKM